jgi:hypothetical protein
MSIDIAAAINTILAENPNAEIMVVCGYGDSADESYPEEEDDKNNPLENDNWFSEAFWDSIYSTGKEFGGGGVDQDAILMDNPLQG